MRLIEALPDTSPYVALRRGGWEFYGWGVDREIRATTFDALSVNTVVTGNWKKPPKPISWPRPVEQKKKREGASVRSLYAALRGGLGK